MLIAVLSDIHDNIWKLDEPNYASFPKVCKARGELFSLMATSLLLFAYVKHSSTESERPSPITEL